MQIQRIQNNNYTPQFQGFMNVQNLKKTEEVIKRNTSQELDKGLAESALKNIFGGSWTNDGIKAIASGKLARYTEVINQTLGLNIKRKLKDTQKIELKSFENGYSVKVENDYKITHIREDMNIWD